MLNGLDLFSGIGGISIALEPWVRPVAYCENDRYAQAVLLSRMADGGLPVAPIWNDVRTLQRQHLPPNIDIISAGFPCQDVSSAGLGIGLGGARSGLFSHVTRLAKELEPQFIFLENVSAIRTRGLSAVIKSLTALGYDSRWGMLSAYDVGAPHKRERWFCLANRRSGRRTARVEVSQQARQSKARVSNWWSVEPDVGRMADGVSNRMDKIRCLGNAVVPTQAREAFKQLMGL